ncbi:hypothetical protein ACFX15_023923 [Malus domestica]
MVWDKLCKSHVLPKVKESVIHLSRLCPFAICVWLASNLGVPLRDLNPPALMDWIIDMANQIASRNFELAFMILLAIWGARNPKFWSDTWDNPVMVVTQCITWWQKFVRTRAQKLGISEILSPPIQAKSLAIRSALVWIIQALKDSSRNLSPLGQVIEDIKALISTITEVSSSRSRYQTNEVTHCLARYGLTIAQTEKLFIGGDLNGHVGRETGNYGGFHGGHGFGERNEDGEAILDFAMAYDLFLANTFFKKREEHVITYKSGSSKTQIDFLLMRKGDRITCKDCKVIPGESVANQHRLLVMDVHIKRVRQKNKTWKCPRTRWWNLKEEKQVIFKEKVITQCVWDREGEASQMWDSMASCIRKVAKEVLGESKGFAPHQKESWWWNEEVQTKVKAKKECCKALYKERTDENGERYRKAKQEAKKAVREAKLAAYDDMYKRLDTKEGELDIYKLSRAREKKTRDLNQVRCIKDEDGKVLATENAVKDRWRGYFHNLFNEGHEMSASLGELSNSEECRNYSFYRRIRKEEVVVALKKMKHKKAIGPDDIPIEVWKLLGETGITWLTDLSIGF